MVGVIVGSKKTGINPDNVATPIAASFGDLITLAILAGISQGLYNCLGEKDVCENKGSVPNPSKLPTTIAFLGIKCSLELKTCI